MEERPIDAGQCTVQREGKYQSKVRVLNLHTSSIRAAVLQHADGSHSQTALPSTSSTTSRIIVRCQDPDKPLRRTAMNGESGEGEGEGEDGLGKDVRSMAEACVQQFCEMSKWKTLSSYLSFPVT